VSDDRPLHVRVAEALGWRDCAEKTTFGAFEMIENGLWVGRGHALERIPRYDLDWSATGPLIERFKLNLYPWSDGSWVADSDFSAATAVLSVDMEGSGATPLIAVCNLILALAAADKLDA
jgi:hypothetical protein